MKNVCYKPYSLKINTKKVDGSSSSTSIDFTLAKFYCDTVCDFKKQKFKDESVYKTQIRKAIELFARKNELRDKVTIQNRLLLEVYEHALKLGATQESGSLL